MGKLKILIATFTFPPNKDGISEASAVLARGMRDQGWEVEVATGRSQVERGPECWEGVPVREFDIRGRGRPGKPYLGELQAYRDYMRSGEWDVVIFESYFWPLYLVLGDLRRISGRKILVSHGYSAFQWEPSRRPPWGAVAWGWSIWLALCLPFWVRRLDRVVYLSDIAKVRGFLDNWVAKLVKHPGRRIIPNGVALDERPASGERFREEFAISSGETMLLCVANYCKRKDQGFAARAFRAARLRGATLVFIGSEFNEYSRRFQAEDESLVGERLGEILWLEKIDRQTTLDAFAACDAFVLSADHEAQPISLLEAMREGKPWIARDAGCIREMPGGVCARTEDELAFWMKKMALDPDLREEVGTIGREAVEETYNLDAYVDSYVKIVREITGQHEQGGDER